MLPLTAASGGDQWPATLEITLADRRRITGRVAWVFAQPPTLAPPWATDPRNLEIRAVGVEDEVTSGNRQPVLLARLPKDADGHLMLGRQRLNPIWLNPPRDLDVEHDPDPVDEAPPDRSRGGHDVPSADSPFSAWRWTLLAERHGDRPPSFDDLGALYAEYESTLWRIAIQRLREASPGVAGEVLDALTRRCHDGTRTIAAWVNDPAQTRRLLNLLLVPGRGDVALSDDALRWTDAQPELLAWITTATPELVEIAAINTDVNPIVTRVDWRGSDDISLAVEWKPGELTRVVIDRPQSEMPPSRWPGDQQAAAPEPTALELNGREVSVVVPVLPRAVAAIPPGVTFPTLRPPLTLAALQTGVPPPVLENHRTTVELRRVLGRWELFFECRRPGPPASGDADQPPDYPDVESMRGREAVAIFIGAETDAADHAAREGVRLIVPETGWHRLSRGRNDGTLQIHRRSYEDRWLCRIVLPEAWLRTGAGETTAFGFARSFRNNAAIHLSPYPGTPWRLSPGRMSVDLSRWEDLP